MDIDQFLTYLGSHRSTRKWATVFSEVVGAAETAHPQPRHAGPRLRTAVLTA